jgi:hypothetical protein
MRAVRYMTIVPRIQINLDWEINVQGEWQACRNMGLTEVSVEWMLNTPS